MNGKQQLEIINGKCYLVWICFLGFVIDGEHITIVQVFPTGSFQKVASTHYFDEKSKLKESKFQAFELSKIQNMYHTLTYE